MVALPLSSLFPVGVDLSGDEIPPSLAELVLVGHGPATGPLPTDAPIGEVVERGAVRKRVYRLADATSPYASVTFVGREGACVATVERAVEVRLHAVRDDGEPDGLATALYVVACGGAGRADVVIAGAPVTWRALDPSNAPAASAALASVIQRDEAALDHEEHAVPASLRSVSLSRANAFLVNGRLVRGADGVWIVADGHTLARATEFPFAEITSGGHTFVACPADSGDYAIDLEQPVDAASR